MIYFELFYAAGLELCPLLESKLLLVEELCHTIGRSGFLVAFQIQRQFALNMRTRTEDPTEFEGAAFKEAESLNTMNSNFRKMTIRDSSSLRLQLAFVFWNEDVMCQMLERLRDYPLSDRLFSRLHNRLCFFGLSAFAMCHKKGYESFFKLGQNCLGYFENLKKHGSVNAKPVYLLMLAMKAPKRKTFTKAINACAEARMINLEAIAKERFAMLLMKENDVALANDYLTSSYWLYRDWGAHAKALELLQTYDFLKRAKKNNAQSSTLSSNMDTTETRKNGHFIPVFSFNTTFQSREKISVRQV